MANEDGCEGQKTVAARGCGCEGNKGKNRGLASGDGNCLCLKGKEKKPKVTEE